MGACATHMGGRKTSVFSMSLSCHWRLCDPHGWAQDSCPLCLLVWFVGGVGVAVVGMPIHVLSALCLFSGRRRSRRHCSSHRRRRHICTRTSTVWDRKIRSSDIPIGRVLAPLVVCMSSQGIDKVGCIEGQSRLKRCWLSVSPPCSASLSHALVGLLSALCLVVPASSRRVRSSLRLSVSAASPLWLCLLLCLDCLLLFS